MERRDLLKTAGLAGAAALSTVPCRRRRRLTRRLRQSRPGTLTAACRAAGSRCRRTTGRRHISSATTSTTRARSRSAPTRCGSPSSAARRSRSPAHRPAPASWSSWATAIGSSLISAPAACATSSRWPCRCRRSTTFSSPISTSITTRTCHTYSPSRRGWDAGSRCACMGHRAGRRRTASST